MAHSFSAVYVKDMESYLDVQIRTLKSKLDVYCKSAGAFDLKKLLRLYVVDTLGELAFSQSFGLQEVDDESLAPPVMEHSLFGVLIGAWPLMTEKLKRWLPLVPYPALQRLIEGRGACTKLAAECVQRRRSEVNEADAGKSTDKIDRKDLLTSLIRAKHPDTGARLSQMDLQTEAFGFM